MCIRLVWSLRAMRPWRCAIAREKAIKEWRRAWKLALIDYEATGMAGSVRRPDVSFDAATACKIEPSFPVGPAEAGAQYHSVVSLIAASGYRLSPV